MLYDGPGVLVKVFDGPNYGELWFDRYPIAIVQHTTETLGRPGYGGGASAPQITIDPAERIVFQHQPLDRRGGALRGTKRVHTDTGVWSVMNEKAFHIEIIGYSDKAVVAKYGGGRRWVGDFDDSDYAFIADVTRYVKDLFGIGDALHALPAGDSWKAGISSPYRLSAHDWEQLDGMTAHGGIFGQTHWDTGVLDLHRIWTPNQGDDDMRVREFVQGLKPANIDELFDAGIIHGDRAYWKGLLAKPDDPAWFRFVTEIEVRTAINSARQASGGGPYKITLSGGAVPG